MVTDPVLDPDTSIVSLREAVRALRAPTGFLRAAAPTSSVFYRAALAMPDEVLRPTEREALWGRYRTVETSALLTGTTLLLVVLPDAGVPTPEVMGTAETVARAGGRAAVLGPGVPRAVQHSPVTVPLRRDDALAREWALVACGPARRVAFLAQQRADGRWDALLTRDAVAVQRAGTAILERVPFLRWRVPVLG